MKQYILVNNRKAYDIASMAEFNKTLKELDINEFKKLLVLVTGLVKTIQHSVEKDLVTITWSYRENVLPVFYRIEEYRNFLKFMSDSNRFRHIATGYAYTKAGVAIQRVVKNSKIYHIPVNSNQLEFDALAKELFEYFKQNTKLTKKWIKEKIQAIHVKYKKVLEYLKSLKKKIKDDVKTDFEDYVATIEEKCSNYISVYVSKKQYRTALKLAKERYTLYVVNIVKRIYKYQNIAIYSDLQKGGRQTNEWALLPKDIRSALFPYYKEIDIVAALPTFLLNLGNAAQVIHKQNIKEHQLYRLFIQEMSDFVGLEALVLDPKSFRLTVGSVFDAKYLENVPSNVKQYLTNIPDDVLIKLGKKLTTQLLGGKRFRSTNDFLSATDIIHLVEEVYFLRANEKIQETDLKKYLTKVKVKFNQSDEVQALKQDLKRIKSFYKIKNIPLFYQQIESEIMIPLFEKFQQTVNKNSILVYDGIDVLDGNIDSKSINDLQYELNVRFLKLLIQIVDFRKLLNFEHDVSKFEAQEYVEHVLQKLMYNYQDLDSFEIGNEYLLHTIKLDFKN